MQWWQILWTAMPPFTPCQKKPLSFHMKISVSFKHLFKWANALALTETQTLGRITYEDIYSTWSCICFSLTPIIIQAYFKTCHCLLSSVVITCQNKNRHILNISSMFLLFFFFTFCPQSRMGLHSSFISIHPEYFVRVQLRSGTKPQILNNA